MRESKIRGLRVLFNRDEKRRRLFTYPLLQFLLTSLTLIAITVAIWLALYGTPSASAKPNVSWPSISLQQFTSGLSSPVGITHAGDGSGRLFIVERSGQIRIYKSGALLATPFLTVSTLITTAGGEQGLLSVAFPPGYQYKGYFYIYYTDTSGDIVVARYRVTADPDIADPNSAQIILTIDHPAALNHNGGAMHFGTDGFLYLGIGDGGSTPQNGQMTNVLLGKILRINVEPGYNPNPPPPLSFTPAFSLYFPLVLANPSPPMTYTIPVTNPYTSTAGYRGEIWAYGLRNPWRLSFDRQTGDLYIADVGESLWEEVNFQPATNTVGLNYGWRCYEGNHAYNLTGCGLISNYTFPATEYSHSQGCSVIGGYVYRGPSYPSMKGIYYYGDLCPPRTIWGLQLDGSLWVTSVLTNALSSISSFGEDQAGELYITGYGNGVIYKLVANPP